MEGRDDLLACQVATPRDELLAVQGGGTQNKFKSKAAAKGRTKRFSRRGRGRGRGRWAAAPQVVQQGLRQPQAQQDCCMAAPLHWMASLTGTFGLLQHWDDTSTWNMCTAGRAERCSLCPELSLSPLGWPPRSTLRAA